MAEGSATGMSAMEAVFDGLLAKIYATGIHTLLGRAIPSNEVDVGVGTIREDVDHAVAIEIDPDRARHSYPP